MKIEKVTKGFLSKGDVYIYRNGDFFNLYIIKNSYEGIEQTIHTIKFNEEGGIILTNIYSNECSELQSEIFSHYKWKNEK